MFQQKLTPRITRETEKPTLRVGPFFSNGVGLAGRMTGVGNAEREFFILASSDQQLRAVMEDLHVENIDEHEFGDGLLLQQERVWLGMPMTLGKDIEAKVGPFETLAEWWDVEGQFLFEADAEA